MKKNTQTWLILLLLLPWIVGFTIYGHDLVEVGGALGTPTSGSAVNLTDISAKPWIPEYDAYVEDEIVSNEGEFYTCSSGHISSIAGAIGDEPGVGGDWESYWTQTVNSPDDDNIFEGDTKWEAIDTGSDGALVGSADGEEKIRIDATGVSMGPVAADPDLTVDDTYSAILSRTATAGATIAVWDVVRYEHAETEHMLADANVTTAYPAECIMVGALDDGGSAVNGEEFLCMIMGYGYNTGWSWTEEDRICLSEVGTTGNTLVACDDASIFSATDDCYQWVGTAETATRVWFDFTKIHTVAE